MNNITIIEKRIELQRIDKEKMELQKIRESMT